MRRALAAAAVSVALLAVASPVQAATVVRPEFDGRLTANGDATSGNLTISYDGAAGRLLLTEPGISEISTTCTDAGDTVSCAVPPSSQVFPDGSRFHGLGVNTGSGDNSVTVTTAVPASLLISVLGGPGNDTFTGGMGPDLFQGGAGADRIFGGGGADIASYSQTQGGVVAQLDGLPTSGGVFDGPVGARDTIATDVEGLYGTFQIDRLTGDGLANFIHGNKGADNIFGLGGPDDLIGGQSNDRVFGGPGKDQVNGDLGIDRLLGGPGIDLLIARDRKKDTFIDCGKGNDSRERVRRDKFDPEPLRC